VIGFITKYDYFSYVNTPKHSSNNPKGEKQQNQKQIKISKVGVTHDKISGRGGIYFVLRYIENISFYQLFEKFFSFLKGSAKGLSTL
jgi:hypothetical protein